MGGRLKTITASEIASRLADRAESVCRWLLPNGKLRSGEWCVGSTGGEAGDSCKIRVAGDKAGLWADFAGDVKGDLLDLIRETRSCGMGEAIKHAKTFLGIVDPENVVPAKKYRKPTKTPPRAIQSAARGILEDDAIAYLDADNWFHPGHLRSLLGLHQQGGVDVCCARRSFHGMDGIEMPGAGDPDEDEGRHVDTSCYLLSRSAFGVIDVWTRMPRMLSPVCDRVFFSALQEQRLALGFTRRATVAFRSQYGAHYAAAGLPPPEGVKWDVGTRERAWLATAEGIQATVRALGFYPTL